MAVRYVWQTVVFTGTTMGAATAAFDEWFGYGVVDISMSRQRIRRQSDGSFYLFMSHIPKPKRYEIHVTALMQVNDPDKDG